MLRTLVIASTLLVALADPPLAAGQEPQRQAVQDRIVAQVGVRSIDAEELRDAVLASRRQALASGALEPFLSEEVDRQLQDLIENKLFALAARTRGLDRRPDVLRRIDAAIDNTLAEIEVFEQLQAQPPTDAELRAFFDAHPDLFRSPNRVHARHIVVRTKDEALALRASVAAGGDFAALARRHNTDSTQSTGGDLGWVNQGVMVHPFEQALFALGTGETSDVVETSMGFHLIHADEVEPGAVPEFEGAKARVRVALLEARTADMKRALAQQFPIAIHEDVLRSLK